MKISDSVRKAALVLHSKFEGASEPLAVFVEPTGAISQTRTSTARFKLTVADTPEQMMGVYDGWCKVTWIEEDLMLMGVK